MSINWQSDAEPAPRILVLPPAAVSLDEAHSAIELWEFYSRKRLDSTQRLAVEVMMAEGPGGRWAARTTGREMPRQNGKGDEIEVVELWGLTQRGEAILHTAHELNTVSSAHQRMSGLLGHRDLKRHVAKILNGLGQQSIEMTNGAVAQYRTRTNGGGRGLDDISRLIVDEAQHAKPEQLASSTPTLLANPNPQMNFIGTGGIAGVSGWWWQQRKRALSAEPGNFGYVGHTAESVWLDGNGHAVQDPVDPEDRTLWSQVNPALMSGRAELEFFEEQYRTLGAALFAREHLGVWDPDDESTTGAAIPAQIWADRALEGSTIASHRQWALAVSPDRKWAALGAAGYNAEDRLHVEWREHRAGTAWIVERCVAAYATLRTPIRIHKSGPEGAYIAPLRAAGVDVAEVSSAEVAQATGQFIDAAINGTLVHLNQPSLNKALGGAVLRESTDGASMWSQRNSAIEITPLMAVTVAAGGVPARQSGGLFLAVT